MLAAVHRLRDSDAFRRTVKGGRRAGSPALVVHLLSGPAAVPSTAGFVVSKAVGGAVVRNRVRRRLQHLVGERLDRLPAGSELVVRALPPSATMSSAELAAELTRCLDRALRATAQPAGTGAPT